MNEKDYTVVSTAIEPTQKTLIRLERIDGENVSNVVDTEDYGEAFEMLGDCLVEQLYKHPEYRSPVKKMFRMIIRDSQTRDDRYNKWLTAIVACFALIGAIWTISQFVGGIARMIGVA